MKYKVKFRINLDGRTIVDSLTVDAKNEKDALKKVKEGTLSRPKLISIEEISNKLPKSFDNVVKQSNAESKVQLNKQETQIAQDTFRSAISNIDKTLVSDVGMKLYSDKREFARNKIIVRLAEMFDDEVDTNY